MIFCGNPVFNFTGKLKNIVFILIILNQFPEINNKKVVVVIPAFNEGAVLRQVAISLLQQAGFTLIVVDDGSQSPLRQNIFDLPLVLLRHRTNLGQGAAIQTGLDYAKKLRPDVVITFDADGQHEAGDLPAMIEPIIHNEADVVMGSRFLSGSATRVPLIRKAVLKIARIINFLLSGMMCSDAHNGLRAMNSKALEKIALTENRMAHATEILFEIKKHKLRFKEVPVHIHYTHYSKQKGQSAWSSIQIFFDLVLHKLFK